MVRQGYKGKGELSGESVSHELCTCMAVLEYVMMEFLLFHEREQIRAHVGLGKITTNTSHVDNGGIGKQQFLHAIKY